MSAEDDAPAATPDAPVLRVLTPGATDEEVAALVAVVAALGPGTAPAPPQPRPVWSAPRRLLRVTHPHGPGAWRASGLP